MFRTGFPLQGTPVNRVLRPAFEPVAKGAFGHAQAAGHLPDTMRLFDEYFGTHEIFLPQLGHGPAPWLRGLSSAKDTGHPSDAGCAKMGVR